MHVQFLVSYLFYWVSQKRIFCWVFQTFSHWEAPLTASAIQAKLLVWLATWSSTFILWPSGCPFLAGSLHPTVQSLGWSLTGTLSWGPFIYQAMGQRFQLLVEGQFLPGRSRHQLFPARGRGKNLMFSTSKDICLGLLEVLLKCFPLGIRWGARTRCSGISTILPSEIPSGPLKP